MALILIVDDALLTRTILRKIVQAEGHNTLEANNGRDAIEMALSKEPDCILLDILIPEFNGWEVKQALNAFNSQIPVIFITADTQETTREKCFNLGATAVIYKPPKAGELQAAIAAALASKQETKP